MQRLSVRFHYLLALVLLAPLLSADVITQMSPQGRQVVLQRDAIVVKQDSASIVYKHFDLKQQRVVKVVLQESSLPYEVNRSAPDARKQIVDLWKRFGFVATVTDTAGKTTRVYDAYIDFYPPGGSGSLLESVPARTDFPVALANGGADLVDFADVARVELQGDQLRVTLANGQVKDGRFLMPTSKPVEARFLGITERYDPSSEDVFDFSLPLARIKEIDFEH
ncbi:MAG TPA: hypothetical protein VI455_03415 [Terriglobia bacterium]